jgi:hypothetical protein
MANAARLPRAVKRSARNAWRLASERGDLTLVHRIGSASEDQRDESKGGEPQRESSKAT